MYSITTAILEKVHEHKFGSPGGYGNGDSMRGCGWDGDGDSEVGMNKIMGWVGIKYR